LVQWITSAGHNHVGTAANNSLLSTTTPINWAR
jgi:hypothetical protein